MKNKKFKQVKSNFHTIIGLFINHKFDKHENIINNLNI